MSPSIKSALKRLPANETEIYDGATGLWVPKEKVDRKSLVHILYSEYITKTNSLLDVFNRGEATQSFGRARKDPPSFEYQRNLEPNTHATLAQLECNSGVKMAATLVSFLTHLSSARDAGP